MAASIALSTGNVLYIGDFAFEPRSLPFLNELVAHGTPPIAVFNSDSDTNTTTPVDKSTNRIWGYVNNSHHHLQHKMQTQNRVKKCRQRRQLHRGSSYPVNNIIHWTQSPWHSIRYTPLPATLTCYSAIRHTLFHLGITKPNVTHDAQSIETQV